MSRYLIFVFLMLYQIEGSLEMFVKAILCLADILFTTSCAGYTVHQVVTIAVGLLLFRVFSARGMGTFFFLSYLCHSFLH